MDHTRAATFLLADGVAPGNVERGYVCRRLIRRAALSAHTLGVREPSLAEIARAFISTYRGAYPELAREEQRILTELTREEQRFQRTLTRGLREFERVEAETRNRGATTISGEDVFRLSDTFGFPAELTAELARERGLEVDLEGYEAALERQRARSRQAISSGPSHRRSSLALGDRLQLVNRLQHQVDGARSVSASKAKRTPAAE